MLFSPVPFGKIILDPNILKEDRKKCIKAGPCGMGERALYLNSFYLSRRYYVVYSEIRRVFKRIAMSSGGFTGKGAFSTIPYLVVVLKDGREKQCNFKVEENVDVILKWIAKNHPEISTVTEKAERAAALQKGQAKADVPKEIQHEIDRIRSDEAYLEKKPEIYQRLSAAVRRKRTIDQMPKSSIILVSAIALAGFIGLASIRPISSSLRSGFSVFLTGSGHTAGRKKYKSGRRKRMEDGCCGIGAIYFRKGRFFPSASVCASDCLRAHDSCFGERTCKNVPGSTGDCKEQSEGFEFRSESESGGT